MRFPRYGRASGISPAQASAILHQDNNPGDAGTRRSTGTSTSPGAIPAPRGCCTVAGKLKLSPNSAGDTTLVVGDACQGMTNSGKPVPGTLCN